MFTCSVCGETYENGWSKEEALDELKENFGDLSEDECASVCDDCYNKMNVEHPFSEFRNNYVDLFMQQYKDRINMYFRDGTFKTQEINGEVVNDYDSFDKFLTSKLDEGIENYFSSIPSPFDYKKNNLKSI